MYIIFIPFSMEFKADLFIYLKGREILAATDLFPRWLQ